MLAEPKPKKELFVKADFPNPQAVELFAYSSDAKCFNEVVSYIESYNEGSV